MFSTCCAMYTIWGLTFLWGLLMFAASAGDKLRFLGQSVGMIASIVAARLNALRLLVSMRKKNKLRPKL